MDKWETQGREGCCAPICHLSPARVQALMDNQGAVIVSLMLLSRLHEDGCVLGTVMIGRLRLGVVVFWFFRAIHFLVAVL